MERKKRIITGKIGSACEHVQYAIEHCEIGKQWLYLTHKGCKLSTDILIGLVESENNRGIRVRSYGLTGKTMNFYLDRQYFNFENL